MKLGDITWRIKTLIFIAIKISHLVKLAAPVDQMLQRQVTHYNSINAYDLSHKTCFTISFPIYKDITFVRSVNNYLGIIWIKASIVYIDSPS
jgi:hypothetical protein